MTSVSVSRSCWQDGGFHKRAERPSNHTMEMQHEAISEEDPYPTAAQWRCCLWEEPSSSQLWSVLSSEWAHEPTSSWEIYLEYHTFGSAEKRKIKKKSLWKRHSDYDSPPGNVGLHYLHHGHRGFVDFDKGPTEALSQSQRVDDFHHFRTDALDTVSGQSVISLTKKVILVQLFHVFILHIEIFQISILLIWMNKLTS